MSFVTWVISGLFDELQVKLITELVAVHALVDDILNQRSHVWLLIFTWKHKKTRLLALLLKKGERTDTKVNSNAQEKSKKILPKVISYKLIRKLYEKYNKLLKYQ